MLFLFLCPLFIFQILPLINILKIIYLFNNYFKIYYIYFKNKYYWSYKN